MVFLRGANNDGGGVGGSVIGHSGTTTNTAGSNAASWGSGVMRLLRRRTVLGFIFCASLLYCVVTVLRDQNEADRVNQFGSDHGQFNRMSVNLIEMLLTYLLETQ